MGFAGNRPMILAAAAGLALCAAGSPAMASPDPVQEDWLPGSSGSKVVHRRGRFKKNARKQRKGKK